MKIRITMKKGLMTLLCLTTMLTTGIGLRAQEITITLDSGWNWISYPNAVAMGLDDAMGDFIPMDGDIIKCRFEYSTFGNGKWRGGLTQFTPGLGYMYYSARTETTSFVFVQAPSSVVTTVDPIYVITTESALVGSTVTIPEGGHVFLRGVCWDTVPGPDIDGSHTCEEADTGTFTSTVEDLTPNTTYYVRAYAVTDNGLAYGEELSFTTPEEGSGSIYGYVDLGLPSGTLWAAFNVGANVPEEYGNYFAWGETQTKNMYHPSNYQFCNGGGLEEFTKYVPELYSYLGYNGFFDNLTALLPEDDAATANWGDDWRMPSREEWEELFQNTICTMATQNGVDGVLVTAANGNSVFMPAAGRVSGSELEQGWGWYWSRSLYTSDDPVLYAHGGRFDNGPDFLVSLAAFHRWDGMSVRAVRCKNSVIEVSANPPEGGTMSGGGSYMDHTECTVSATANEGYVFNCWTENGDVVSTDTTYTFVVGGNQNLVANFLYYGTSHDYVDLGLPSGTLWATCNVGANASEDYGCYFAWGETLPKAYYWGTYQYYNNSYLTKYCNNSNYGYNGFTDSLTILLPEDDAATANWGNDWRMPTKEEWQELNNYTTCTWTTQNGVNGRLFTANNGNSLFLPAAGGRYGSYLVDVGNYGYYWSSSLYTDYPDNAWLLYFDSGNYNVNVSGRGYGRSVRAVRCKNSVIEVSVNPTEGGTVSGGGTYMDHTECTVSATANEDYVFINWTEYDDHLDENREVSTDSTYTFIVNGNRTLVANFLYTITVPTVTTAEVTEITSSSAIVGGTITNTGNGTISECGISYKTSGDDWTDLPIEAIENVFSTTLSGLAQGTTYTVRAYATNQAGTGYGEEKTFTTLIVTAPTVTTAEVTEISFTSAIVGGTITSTGNGTISECGISYKTSGDVWTDLPIEAIENVFSTTLSALTQGTNYTVRAYATNEAGTGYGEEKTFTTLIVTAPTVTTAEVTGITSTSAIVGGTITSTGNGTISECGISYKTSGDVWTDLPIEAIENVFSTTLSALTQGTTYTVRAYATNEAGIGFGEEKTFTTVIVYNISVSANPTNGGTVTGNGSYVQSQSCTVTATANSGYIFTNWTENGSVVSTNASYTFTVTGNRTLVANFNNSVPQGAINGKFTINSDGSKVYFSKGNLQYIGSASTPYWKFADHQWDYIGSTTGQSSSSANVDRDLFGWGTSGYSHGATCYQPWSTNTTNSNYYAYGSATRNLYESTGKADWGYNKISNGGNTANSGWRALTQPEWNYVFFSRSTNTGIRFAKAKVNNVNGVILLPDDWQTTYYSLNSTNLPSANYTTNTITASQWDTLEQHGAIFLPAAGYRCGTTVYDVNSFGTYWSSTCYNGTNVRRLLFYASYLAASNYNYRSDGHSVRLVRPVN